MRSTIAGTLAKTTRLLTRALAAHCPSISNAPLTEPNLAHQHGCQVPYATFHLHPDAALDDDSGAAPSPPILHDSDSGSSISDVEWETIHRPMEHVVDGMIEAGEDIISAVNDFSSLIASTMREASPTTADANGLGVPQSTRKRQLPLTSHTVRTRSAAKAARKRLCPPTPQATGSKRKSPHAAGAACKRLTTDQAAQTVTSPTSTRKSTRAASAARVDFRVEVGEVTV